MAKGTVIICLERVSNAFDKVPWGLFVLNILSSKLDRRKLDQAFVAAKGDELFCRIQVA